MDLNESPCSKLQGIKADLTLSFPPILRDYRGAMNYYILPEFGNTPIDRITFMDVEEFISDLECSPKRINNLLVPMRSIAVISA